MTKVILVTEMVLEGLETPTSCKVVKINVYGTSIIQQAWLHYELEPTGSILSDPSRGSLYDFKPVSSVVISKRRRSTIGYGIFDESGIQIYFVQMQATNGFISGFALLFCFTGFGQIPMFAMGGKVELISFVFRFYGII